LLCLLLFHCQAVSPQAALFLMGHATAVFFHYISFNRYADLICCTVTISGAFDKIDTIQKVVQIKVYCLEWISKARRLELNSEFLNDTGKCAQWPSRISWTVTKMYVALIMCYCALKLSNGFNQNTTNS
jgi:hypothetical protein